MRRITLRGNRVLAGIWVVIAAGAAAAQSPDAETKRIEGRAHCTGDSDPEFVAYWNPELDGPAFVPGAGEWVANDVELIVDDCILSSYEVGVRGTGGAFTLEVELWSPCGRDYVIEGTHRVYEGDGYGWPELAHFDFPGGIALPSGSLWVAVMANNDSTGWIIADEPALGQSDGLLAFWDAENNECIIYWFEPVLFNATIWCQGDPPMGACCDMAGDEPYCRETPEIDCLGTMARWEQGKTCDDLDAFDPPCGYAACCLPPENPYLPSEGCVDLPQYDPRIPCTADKDCPRLDCPEGGGFCETGFGLPIPCMDEFDCPPGILCNEETWYCERGFGCSEIFERIACQSNEDCPNNDCDTNRGYCIQEVEEHPAIWSRGKFCEIRPKQDCILWTCLHGEGPCDVAHPWPETGCNDPECCDEVCRADMYCCLYNWDLWCANMAQDICDGLPMNDECVGKCVGGDNDGDPCYENSNCPPDGMCDGGAIPVVFNEQCWCHPDCLCAEAFNTRATVNPDDPGFCCHPAGAGTQGAGSLWYTFETPAEKVKIDTCSSLTGEDSLVEVYEVTDWNDPCNNLSPIACNDDGGCSGLGESELNSRMDVFDLTIGETYYIQLASKTSMTKGKYKLKISPTSAPTPPGNNWCDSAAVVSTGVPAPFDLADATMDCPIELCLPAMQNDAWFDFLAFEGGLYIATTCPESGPGPDTTLAVYGTEGINEQDWCPVDPEWRVAVNDDWGGDCGSGSRVFFSHPGGMTVYKIRVGGEDGGEPSGMLTIRRAEDCQPNGFPDEYDIAQGWSEDVNANGIPDECEPGDFNGDGEVDLPDFADFVDCLTGPCGNPPCEPALYSDPACRIGDFGYDGDIDLDDFGGFQVTFTGP